MEQALRKAFILDLFRSLRKGTPGRGVTRLPVKQVGLELAYSTKTTVENWMASCVITGHIVVSLKGKEIFRTEDHSAYLREGMLEVWKRRILWRKEALSETLAGAPVKDAGCLRRATKTGAWMMVQPSTVNGTEMGGQEWQDALYLRYDIEHPDLTKLCDSCSTAFSISNALN